MPTLARVLLQSLKAHGAREIFGIPGDFVLPLYKEIEDSRILPHFTLSHEPAVGFAADGSARHNSGLGVGVVTYGAGAFNSVNAVAGAYAERSPVVLIAGAPGAAERRSGFQLHHQARSLDTQANVYREITCDQAILTDAAAAPHEINRVLRAALERSLPVYIEFPRDMTLAPTTFAPPLPRSAPDAQALAECAAEILARLAAAKRPVMIVDVEVRRYGVEAKLAEFARRHAIPVVTTFMGRGLMAQAPDVVLGTYLGAAGDVAIMKLVETSDCALLLGVILSDTNFAVSARKLDMRRCVHAIDRGVRIGFHHYADVPLDALVQKLRAAPRPAQARPAPKAKPARYRRGLPADATRLKPSDIACAVNDLFDRHGPMPMTADIGDCLFTAMEIDNTDLAAPGYYAGMGFGVPAGIGVAASGKRPLILVGDGAFQMTGFELGNCRRYGLDPVVVLFNNASWEMLRVFQPESKFNDLDDWKFADMAAGMGGHGVRVATRKALAEALEAAWHRRGTFSIVEVMLTRGETSETLARFVAGMKAARKKLEAAK